MHSNLIKTLYVTSEMQWQTDDKHAWNGTIKSSFTIKQVHVIKHKKTVQSNIDFLMGQINIVL